MYKLRTVLLVTSALVPLGLAPAVANPLGAQVVGGSATVQGQGTATVTVTQQTNSAIINWNTFNIGGGEKTNIAMPSASSVQLDRVTGGLGPSQILGSLWSNGRVFLVNPDGILFGSGAKVDTAGFLATTSDIKNTDFMAGRYNFSIHGRPDASIVNQGTITAQSGGFAALVAPGVRNSGTITANLGTIALASGNVFTLDFYGDKLITLGVNDSIAATVKDVSTGQPLSSLVSNQGTLKADGGRVELTAVAARQVVDSVINNTGVIEANTIGTHNGMIVLGAATAATKPAGAPTQTVKVSGTLSAAGKKKGTTGGTIEVTGEAIALTGAKIDASGAAGGGTVLIGGDVGGGNPNPAVASIPQAQLQPHVIPTASTVTVDATTTINASARDTGNGGKVVVWADQSTLFDGSISVRGGATFGNGGFVETSGHQQLAFNGTVDTGAPNGRHGTLLLDPLDAIIQTTAGAGVVTVSSIQTALASGDVIVTTGSSGSQPGDITVASPISWANASALTLSAYRNIAVNANITNTGGAAVTLRADNTGTGVGTVNFSGGAQVSTAGPMSIFYNPSVNPAGSAVNTTSYVSPIENYSGYVTGGGTLTAYMLVNTVYDLQNIQNNLSGTYALGTNIDASATASWNSGAGFVPIAHFILRGAQDIPFSGVIDGLNHTIDHLTINSLYEAIGLIGLLEPNFAGVGGIITNLGLTNVNISAVGSYNYSVVGGLVGENAGTIRNSYVDGVVSGGPLTLSVGGLVGENYFGSIDQSHSSASVSIAYQSTNQAVVGGLVGDNLFGTITRSYASGPIYPFFAYSAGGLVGTNQGSIDQSYATGAVNPNPTTIGGTAVYMGGLVGDNYSGQISRSYATGTVSGGISSYGLGGLVGLNDGGSNVSSSYWDIYTTTQNYAYGDQTSYGSTGLTTVQLKSGLPSGFDPTVWGINATINNGYPYLLWQVASTTPPPTILTGGPPALITITVTANDLFKVYGTADPTLTYQITSGGLSGSDTFSGSLTHAPGNNVGTYAINLGTLALPSAYTLTYVGATLTITPVSLTITANSTSRQVGAANPTLSGSVTGFVNGESQANATTGTLAFTTTATIASAAGSYPITGSGLTANYGNYLFVQAPRNATALTITQQPSLPADVYGTGQTQLIYSYISLKTESTVTTTFSVTEATAGGRIYAPLSQLDGSLYVSGSLALNDWAETCRATVYTMIARALGDPGTTIDKFYDPTLGAITTLLPPNTISPFPAKPINDQKVIDLLNSGTPIVLQGTWNVAGTEPHTMLATSVKDGMIVANDPWTGKQVLINPNTNKVVDPPNFALPNFVVTAYQVVNAN